MPSWVFEIESELGFWVMIAESSSSACLFGGSQDGLFGSTRSSLSGSSYNGLSGLPPVNYFLTWQHHLPRLRLRTGCFEKLRCDRWEGRLPLVGCRWRRGDAQQYPGQT